MLRTLFGFDGGLVLFHTGRNVQVSVYKRRKWLSINTQASWKPPSCLSSTDQLGQWLYSPAPSEVHRSWMMTLLFRAGLSPFKTLHYFGSQDKSNDHLELAEKFKVIASELCYVFSLT